MPNPKANETKDDFMNRCIPQLIKEGKEQDQAVAICSNMYDEQKMSKKDKMFKRLFKNG